MKRLIALVVLALIAAPVAMAATHHAKPRCANKRYAKKHKRLCKRKKPAPQPSAPAATTTTTTSATPPPAPNTPTPQQPNTPTPTPTPTPTRLAVVAREFSLTLSKTTTTSGDAIIQLQNFGEDPHDLRVERVDASGTPTDFPLTQPHTQQSETVTLGPGTYKLYCTLPGHDAAGMHATLTVVP